LAPFVSFCKKKIQNPSSLGALGVLASWRFNPPPKSAPFSGTASKESHRSKQKKRRSIARSLSPVHAHDFKGFECPANDPLENPSNWPPPRAPVKKIQNPQPWLQQPFLARNNECPANAPLENPFNWPPSFPSVKKIQNPSSLGVPGVLAFHPSSKLRHPDPGMAKP
jgi:hypothetical protein